MHGDCNRIGLFYLVAHALWPPCFHPSSKYSRYHHNESLAMIGGRARLRLALEKVANP